MESYDVEELLARRVKEASDGRYFSYPGQKATIIDRIAGLVPRSARRLVEPFVGSGVVASALAFMFEEVECSDALPGIVVAHERAVSDPEGFVRDLRATFEEFDGDDPREGFERARDEYSRPGTTDGRRAELLMYLGARSFSHLIRHNDAGGFSASFHEDKVGTSAPGDAVARFARNLGGKARFLRRDYGEALEGAGAGDFVYCDPPYMPLDGAKTNFDSYAGAFGREGHVRLARLAREAADRGAKVVVSNHDSADVRVVYGAADSFLAAQVPRKVANRTKDRKLTSAKEVLIVFRPPAGAARGQEGRRRRLRREYALDRFGDMAREEDLLERAYDIARSAGFVRAGEGRTNRELTESGRNLLTVARRGTPSLRRLCLERGERVEYLSLNLAARMAREAGSSPEERTRVEREASRLLWLCVSLEGELGGTERAAALLARALRFKVGIFAEGRLEVGRLGERYVRAAETLDAVGASFDSESGSRLLLLAELCPDGCWNEFGRVCRALSSFGSGRPLLAAFPARKGGHGHGVAPEDHVPLGKAEMLEIARRTTREIRERGG